MMPFCVTASGSDDDGRAEPIGPMAGFKDYVRYRQGAGLQLDQYHRRVPKLED